MKSIHRNILKTISFSIYLGTTFSHIPLNCDRTIYKIKYYIFPTWRNLYVQKFRPLPAQHAFLRALLSSLSVKIKSQRNIEGQKLDSVAVLAPFSPCILSLTLRQPLIDRLGLPCFLSPCFTG